ncbi:DUF4229 domain-containing protein [Agrococcus sp. SL85]|uniref:DUF4229 domain-containing protein n=1 Tax=Agrococcus sp. SL85 TaxID=2995141 RepID=UPI00226CFF85|nr:DUF4229 domain-containing protein [Agrococcus sp. SL85]WAC67358.1 DUF4229 domain-containing protein [Agrococcus sp. SL85]
MAPSLRYLVVRTLLFLVPFALLMVASVPWWLSLLVSLAFAFAASIVFFGRLRQDAAADLQRMREGRRREGARADDGDVEDEALGDGDAGERDAPADDRADGHRADDRADDGRAGGTTGR